MPTNDFFVISPKAAYTFGGGSGDGRGADDSGVSGGVGGIGGDGMGSTPASAAPAPVEAWAPTAEQEHNLQLFELVMKLREALLSIPALITPEGGDVAGTGVDLASFAVGCRKQIAEAVRAVDETASRAILEPYLSGVARALDDIVAKMHRCGSRMCLWMRCGTCGKGARGRPHLL